MPTTAKKRSGVVRPKDSIELAEILRKRSASVELLVNDLPGADPLAGSIERASRLPDGRYALGARGEVQYLGTKDESTMTKTLTRAAEHIVSDDAGAPPNSGSLAAVIDNWVVGTPDRWAAAEMAVAPAITVHPAGVGRPQFAEATSMPTAGKQTGEKQDVTSDAFELAAVRGATLDASTVLNYSAQLIAEVGTDSAVALMTGALARELDSQILSVMTTASTAVADLAAALATFDGVWRPTHVVAAPGAALGLEVSKLSALGLEIVLDTSATSTYVVDSSGIEAVVNRPMTFERDEPSLLGRSIGLSALGAAYVHDGAVASF